MPITVPNQRVIKIHRETVKKDFLGIKNENWQAASRDLGAYGLQIYLYLASNANNFTLAFSPKAIRESTGLAESTCKKHFLVLVEKGYLVESGKNTFDFYEKPLTTCAEPQESFCSISCDFLKPQESLAQPQESIEINKNKTDTINNWQEKQVSLAKEEFKF